MPKRYDSGKASILDRSCKNAKEAFLIAQGDCARRNGNTCLAYHGGLCRDCKKRRSGINRRLANFKKEKKETIAEKVFADGSSARVRETDGYFRIEFGSRPSDAKTIFCVDRSIHLTEKEKDFLKELLCDKNK